MSASIVTGTAGTAFTAVRGLMRLLAAARASPAVPGQLMRFRLDGNRVVRTTMRGDRMLARLPGDGTPYEKLRALLDGAEGDNDHRLDNLASHGQPFTAVLTLPNGDLVEAEGRALGGFAELVLRRASPGTYALRAVEAELAETRRELALTRRLLDSAPVQAFAADKSRKVRIANVAYLAATGTGVSDALSWPVGDIYSDGAPRESATWKNQKIERDGTWIDVTRLAHPDGSYFCYATDATQQVRAEASLKNFLSTLTETFVHLETGLAVFDDNRRLTLFNPALSELTAIPAAALARRPPLRDFFEMLRSNRRVPEQRDFLTWKRKLIQLEAGAEDGTYQEVWPLPGGEVYRVTGKPQVHGGIAFLFEDISRIIMLERRYRAEIELSQTILDRINDAVAVFGTTGTLLFANSAFDTMWETETMTQLAGADIQAMTELWESKCGPAPVFEDIRAYVTGGENRHRWQLRLDKLDGGKLLCRFAALPDGATLVVFSDVTSFDNSVELLETRLGELKMEGEISRAAVEAISEALQNLGGPDDPVPDSPLPDGSHGPEVISRIRTLIEFLNRAPNLVGIAGTRTGSLLDTIRMHLARSGQDLEIEGFLATDPYAADRAELRRLLWALCLAAADLAGPQTVIHLHSTVEACGELTLTAELTLGERARAKVARPVSLRFLERCATMTGGGLRIATAGEGWDCSVTVTLPNTGETDRSDRDGGSALMSAS